MLRVVAVQGRVHRRGGIGHTRLRQVERGWVAGVDKRGVVPVARQVHVARWRTGRNLLLLDLADVRLVVLPKPKEKRCECT